MEASPPRLLTDFPQLDGVFKLLPGHDQQHGQIDPRVERGLQLEALTIPGGC